MSEPPLLLNMETASLDVSRGTISSDTSITITAANAYFRGEVTVTAPSVRWPAWLIRRCRRHHVCCRTHHRVRHGTQISVTTPGEALVGYGATINSPQLTDGEVTVVATGDSSVAGTVSAASVTWTAASLRLTTTTASINANGKSASADDAYWVDGSSSGHGGRTGSGTPYGSTLAPVSLGTRGTENRPAGGRVRVSVTGDLDLGSMSSIAADVRDHATLGPPVCRVALTTRCVCVSVCLSVCLSAALSLRGGVQRRQVEP